MKEEAKNILESIDRLVSTEIKLTKNEDKINRHRDYSTANQIYWIFGRYVPELLTELIETLEINDKENTGGQYGVWRVFFQLQQDEKFEMLCTALSNHCHDKNVAEIILKLKGYAINRERLINRLLKAA